MFILNTQALLDIEEAEEARTGKWNVKTVFVVFVSCCMDANDVSHQSWDHNKNASNKRSINWMMCFSIKDTVSSWGVAVDCIILRCVSNIPPPHVC